MKVYDCTLNNVRDMLKTDVDFYGICAEMLDHLISGVALYEVVGDKIRALYLNDGYYDAIGYTREQYEPYLGNITGTLCEGEHEHIMECAEKCYKSGEMLYLEAKGKRYDGSDIWVLIKAKAVDFIDTDNPVFLALVQDLTARKKQALQQAISLERYYMLAETTSAIVFEYDIDSDVMSFLYRNMADNTRQKREILNYRETSRRTVIVHPDDMEKFYKAFYAACRKSMRGTLDYRTTAIDQSTYRWARTIYSSIADDSGKVIKLIGRIQDIDEERKEQERIVRLIEVDATTGVLNKLTATTKIQQLMEEPSPAKSFFAIVDIDNFKAVNDTYGHSYGDDVLYTVGQHLKRTFPNYIIGRFGGDEFLMFGRGVSVSAVIDSFEDYLEAVNKLNVRNGDCDIHCSIGVSWSDSKGKTYADFFDLADEQLYKAKKSGKNRVEYEKLL